MTPRPTAQLLADLTRLAHTAPKDVDDVPKWIGQMQSLLAAYRRAVRRERRKGAAQ